MQLNEIQYEGQPPVEGYGAGFFRIGAEKLEGPLLILPEGVCKWDGLKDLKPIITAKDEFDVLFIGMGADIAPVPAAIRNKFEKAGIAFEVMGSPPACRTYNILLSEGRRIALAALPV